MRKVEQVIKFILVVIVVFYINKYFIQDIESFNNQQEFNKLQNEDASNNSGNPSSDLTKQVNLFPETIVEKSLNNLYNGATKLICNMSPAVDTALCLVDGKPMTKYLFPIHIIKLPDTRILAVFNDGRLYQKNDILDNMWKGPIKNSLPFDSVPLRMVTISYRDNSLLGVGYDNNLYAKQANEVGGIDIYAEWVLVPNNQDIIYCLVDQETKNLICINVDGEVLIKEKKDLTSDLKPVGDISIPILKLFYDSNGYMLALDTKFNLVQYSTKKWKESSLNYDKGINRTRVFDIIYDNDGKLFGLVFVPGVGILELMKQQQIYFMSDFVPLEFHTDISLHSRENFTINDMKIILLKTGVNMVEDNSDYGAEHNRDEDLYYAYMKSMIDDKKKLRKFCRERGVGTASKYENYEMVNRIQEQSQKIDQLNRVLSDMMSYEPDKHQIQEEVLLQY